ncbi:MAG: bifunctional diguanylate cyclase/phosphodiesterase [Magnetovibrio sp.]|nr:bifunctional diguanylate cyclase/phosphodiesterase [Magnetovibrio sp.]
MEGSSWSIGQLLIVLSATVLTLTVLLVFGLSSFVEKRAVNNLAKEEARQTAQLVFQSLYSAMRKGWTKTEIAEIITRLNLSSPDLKINVYRGYPVIKQFGEIVGEKAIRDHDVDLNLALLRGKEALIVHENEIRYLYPVAVKTECQVCHKADLGAINGVVDITYPVNKLKVSLGFVVSSVVGSFTLIMILLFALTYFVLRVFVAKPISSLEEVMKDVTADANFGKRVFHGRGWAREIRNLGVYFNNLLSTVQDYHSKLEEYTVRDPLTDLYNRKKFADFVKSEVQRAKRHDRCFTLILLDMDNFKNINDTFGHPIGDLALKEVANLLIQETRNTDIVARLGGDKFAILLPETEREPGEDVAEKLRASLAAASLDLPVGHTRFHGSFGFVSFPEDGEDFEALSVAMDMAMYKAKRGGKNRVSSLSADDDASEREMSIFKKGKFLRMALNEDRVEPFFQPIINVNTGKPYAFEVLARIREENAYITADEFIEAAEELGMAQEIDERIFIKGLKALSAFKDKDVRLFFNLSAKTMGDLKHMRKLPGQIELYGIALDRIVLEITEREALPHFKEIMDVISELRAEGLAFALDDFGSGFSSFIYLKYLEIDFVKIEGSFVRHMATDKNDHIVVKHISAMAKEFGIETVAEFVEDELTHDLLQELGVDYAQGYHYSVAMKNLEGF